MSQGQEWVASCADCGRSGLPVWWDVTPYTMAQILDNIESGSLVFVDSVDCPDCGTTLAEDFVEVVA